MTIVVVGSGLSSISAIKALVNKGVKPLVLDCGIELGKDKKEIVQRLSRLPSEEWDKKGKEKIVENKTLHDKENFPQKLAFGSDFFYGKSSEHSKTENIGPEAPYSFAKGGLSVGWGASILPPADEDLTDWPIGNEVFNKYYPIALKGIPLSADDDDLKRLFPVYSDSVKSLKRGSGNSKLLSAINKVRKSYSPDEVCFGQARMLTKVTDTDDLSGCSYCGYCMSGCVYNCIYKTITEIDSLVEKKLIDYRKDIVVKSFSEENGVVTVTFINEKNEVRKIDVEKVFLGAGAVNSTRIILESKKLYDKEIRLLSTVAFVVPMIRLFPLPAQWPEMNTQPGIFFEFVAKKLSKHWIHTQLSTPNELVYEMLNIKEEGDGLFGMLMKYATRHLVIAHCNINSNDSNGYFLTLKSNDVLVTRREYLDSSKRTIKLAAKAVSKFARKFNCFTLRPMIKDTISSGGYHVGGTMPMKSYPTEEIHTDLQGRPKNMKNVHVIDSSTFPSIPGTTIGLISMANATRIVSEVVK